MQKPIGWEVRNDGLLLSSSVARYLESHAHEERYEMYEMYEMTMGQVLHERFVRCPHGCELRPALLSTSTRDSSDYLKF